MSERDLYSYAIVRKNSLHDNAAMGLRGGGSSNVLIEGNTIFRNTTAPYNTGYSAGGVKVVVADQWIFRNNVVYDNYGPGLWCDIGCKGVVYDGNRVYNTRSPAGHGIFYELSTDGVIKNNIVYDNAGSGIYVSNASANRVEGNISVRNKYGDILLDQRNRQVAGQPPPPLTWNTYGNVIQNNTLMSQSAYALITAIDYNNYGIFTKNTTDRNSVYNVDPTWYSWGGAYGSPSAFCAARKQECNSTALTAAQVNQILTANGIPLTAPTKSQPSTSGKAIEITLRHRTLVRVTNGGISWY